MECTAKRLVYNLQAVKYVLDVVEGAKIPDDFQNMWLFVLSGFLLNFPCSVEQSNLDIEPQLLEPQANILLTQLSRTTYAGLLSWDIWSNREDGGK